MDKEFLNFLKDAYSNGLCKEYRDEIRKCHEDKLQLVRLAMRQQSCPWVATKMYEGVITTDYILNTFGEYINGYTLHDVEGVEGFTYGLYVDYDYDNDLLVDKDVIHIMHTVGANIVVPQTKAPTIYISNRSNVHLVGDGYNNINIKLFDKSKVTIEDLDENSEVVAYKYSDDAQVELGKYCLGKVKEFRKELKL